MARKARSKAKDAALWMLKKFIEDDGILYQQEAALTIEELFGEGVTYINNNGNTAIAHDVLSEFRKLTKDSVVWVRAERYWRRKENGRPGTPRGLVKSERRCVTHSWARQE